MSEEDVRAKLNRETAKLAWEELAPFFARGQIMAVKPSLDLIEVAACISEDNVKAVGAWQDSGELFQPNDQNAAEWHKNGQIMWVTVIAPWVIIQAIE